MIKGFLRHFRIQYKVMIGILASIVLLSWLVLIIIRTFTIRIIEDNMYDYLEITQKEIGKNLELIYDEINMTAVRLMMDSKMIALFTDKDLAQEDKLIKFRQQAEKENLGLTNIANIIIADSNENIYKLRDQNLQMLWANNEHQRLIEETTNIIEWLGAITDEEGNNFMVMGKKFRNLNTGKQLGTMYILIPQSVLSDACNQIAPGIGYTFIMDNQDRVLVHPDNQKVGNIIYDSDFYKIESSFHAREISMGNEKYIMAISSLSDNLSRFRAQYRVVSLVYHDKLFTILHDIDRYVIYIMSAVSLIAVVLANRISFAITRPIRRLTSKISAFAKDTTLKTIKLDQTKDELWELEQSYHEMTDRIKDLITRINNEKEIQRELEFIALQAQINPHFLYNTLDAIGWIAKIKKQAEIEKLVLSLAKFFRISLHKGDKYITVQEELELVQSYVNIEQIRFPDRFMLSNTIDDDILSCKIPKIILQPIVENAIKHGISEIDSFGKIQVGGWLENKDIVFSVTDNGIGFDQSTLPAKQSMNGYGLRNVHERIQLEYGQGYGVSVESTPGKGTCVTLRLKYDAGK